MTLSAPRKVAVFLAFALGIFLSAVLRAITATLAPALTQELALQARDLGLLAGGFFLGCALMQLPLGSWLDRYGPRRVVIVFLVAAVAGCLAFSAAETFPGLLVARVLCGVGVSGCLMAPLTGFRRWFEPALQLRANSWSLMVASLGIIASTLPVQWLLPVIGWRPVFVGLAVLAVLVIVAVAVAVPPYWESMASARSAASAAPGAAPSYAAVWRHPFFRRMMPLGFFCYGGMVAMQALWVGPWLVRVAGHAPLEAAQGLLTVNLCMLCAFWLWGVINPHLHRRGYTAERLIARGLPLSFVAMAAIIASGESAGAWHWAAFCVSSTFVSLAQPAVGMAFPPALAGRALSGFNLLIFSGVFTVQWGIGLLVDGFMASGLSTVDAFRAAMAVFLVCCVSAYAYFVWASPHNRPQVSPSP